MKSNKKKYIVLILMLFVFGISIITLLIIINYKSIDITNNKETHYTNSIDSNKNLVNNYVKNSSSKKNINNTNYNYDNSNQFSTHENANEYDNNSEITINANQIFKDIDINNIDNEQLNNCVITLYQTLYYGTNNKNISNINEFIDNNFITNFYGSDRDINNLIYRIYTTKQLDILNPDGIYINFESLNNISDIQSTYEFASFKVNISCHVIQHLPNAQGPDTTQEWDTTITQTIKISRDGKMMSLINII